MTKQLPQQSLLPPGSTHTMSKMSKQQINVLFISFKPGFVCYSKVIIKKSIRKRSLNDLIIGFVRKPREVTK